MWGNPTLLQYIYWLWSLSKKIYWEKVNIDTINWEKVFDRSADHK